MLSPKEHFCGGCRLCCPISLLLCSELSNPSPFPPSALRSRPSHPCSFPAPCKETHVQLSIFKWLFFPAACFPSGSLSSHHPSRLRFPACPSLWPFGCPCCWQGSPLPWRSDSPGCLSPSHTATHLLLLFAFSSSSLLVQFGVASLITHLLSASTSSCCSSAVDLFIVWDRLAFLFYSMWIISQTKK